MKVALAALFLCACGTAGAWGILAVISTVPAGAGVYYAAGRPWGIPVDAGRAGHD